jgi:hypothetical protein
MSPSAPRPQRQQFVRARPRSEVVIAVVVSAGIVLGTALLVWLMRPGTVGVPGGGGILNRQPRMTILVLLAAAAIGGVVLYVVRRRHAPRFGTRGSIAIGSAVTIVAAVVAGIFWPGGVIRHWPPQFKLPDVTPTSVPSSTPTTASNTATTKAGTATTVTTATTGSSVTTPTTVSTPTPVTAG